MKYMVEGHSPDGRAGDGMEIEASSRAEAEAAFLEAHPGWIVE